MLEALKLAPELNHEGLVSEASLAAWTADYRAALVKVAGERAVLGIDYQFVSADSWNVEIRFTSSGTLVTDNLDRDFFVSSEYRHLSRLGHLFADPLAAGSRIVRGDGETPVSSLGEVFDTLLDQARRGTYVQRYKGLGEMNPEQLWETTMNAETRNLVQVRIEDAVAADQIFSVLMGDQVEPRREFIERYARTVTNLDT